MYRNQQALGKTPNFEPAVRMATVRWDQSMADLASLNARACTFQHDKCRNTGTIIQCPFFWGFNFHFYL